MAGQCRNNRERTSGATWMPNFISMSSQTVRNGAGVRLTERGERSFKQTLAMAVARSRMDERTSCEALELMSLWGSPICSGGIGGDWATEGSGITVALAARTWELVVGGVGGPTVSQAASKVIGVALVWRGGELCRGEILPCGRGGGTWRNQAALLAEGGRLAWSTAMGSGVALA